MLLPQLVIPCVLALEFWWGGYHGTKFCLQFFGFTIWLLLCKDSEWFQNYSVLLLSSKNPSSFPVVSMHLGRILTIFLPLAISVKCDLRYLVISKTWENLFPLQKILSSSTTRIIGSHFSPEVALVLGLSKYLKNVQWRSNL